MLSQYEFFFFGLTGKFSIKNATAISFMGHMLSVKRNHPAYGCGEETYKQTKILNVRVTSFQHTDISKRCRKRGDKVHMINLIKKYTFPIVEKSRANSFARFSLIRFLNYGIAS